MNENGIEKNETISSDPAPKPTRFRTAFPNIVSLFSRFYRAVKSLGALAVSALTVSSILGVATFIYNYYSERPKLNLSVSSKEMAITLRNEGKGPAIIHRILISTSRSCVDSNASSDWENSERKILDEMSSEINFVGLHEVEIALDDQATLKSNPQVFLISVGDEVAPGANITLLHLSVSPDTATKKALSAKEINIDDYYSSAFLRAQKEYNFLIDYCDSLGINCKKTELYCKTNTYPR